MDSVSAQLSKLFYLRTEARNVVFKYKSGQWILSRKLVIALIIVIVFEVVTTVTKNSKSLDCNSV
jgi:hypothetical protein